MWSLLVLTVEMWGCSGAECGFHANIHWWCVVPAYLWQEMDQSWCASGGVRVERLLHLAIRVPTVLDHQELVGEAVGRAWVLQAMPRSRYVWDEHNGFSRYDLLVR